jgi:hypothetical protein
MKGSFCMTNTWLVAISQSGQTREGNSALPLSGHRLAWAALARFGRRGGGFAAGFGFWRGLAR